jgi:hypothetical protein
MPLAEEAQAARLDGGEGARQSRSRFVVYCGVSESRS